MSEKQQWNVTLAAFIGFAAWFFGNVYEAIVFSPNWVTQSAAQMTRLNEFFVHTSPTHYFIPASPLALLALWWVAMQNRVVSLARAYSRALAFSVASVVVTVLIVSLLIPRLFGDSRDATADVVFYCWLWNFANVVRMAIVGTIVVYLFQVLQGLHVRRVARSA